MQGVFVGVQQTSYNDETQPPQNQNMSINEGNPTYVTIGRKYGASNYFDGYMASTIWIDGTQYAASDFGAFDSTSGEWTPNGNPTVSYGTNGFKLDFRDFTGNSGNNIGYDYSGNQNNFSPDNFGGNTDGTTDSPTNNFFAFIAGKIIISPHDIFLGFLAGFFQLGFGFILITIGARTTSSAMVGIIMLTEAVLGPFWAWLFINESSSYIVLIGGMIVISAVLLQFYTSIKGEKKTILKE